MVIKLFIGETYIEHARIKSLTLAAVLVILVRRSLENQVLIKSEEWWPCVCCLGEEKWS